MAEPKGPKQKNPRRDEYDQLSEKEFEQQIDELRGVKKQEKKEPPE